jgi:hypothetical protein
MGYIIYAFRMLEMGSDNKDKKRDDIKICKSVQKTREPSEPLQTIH